MSSNKFYFSGSAAGLPPREFLKTLPVRLSYLVFDAETDSQGSTHETLKELKKMLFSHQKSYAKRPSYFIMDENDDSLHPIDTIDYLTESFSDVFPSGSGWAVRWEKHSSFVTITFFRYFTTAASISHGGESALACLRPEVISPEKLLSETVLGGYIDIAVIPHTWNPDKTLHEMGLRPDNNPFVTQSKVFDDVAEVWMSFEAEEKTKPRPVVIFGTPEMNEKVAGELIQVLLEIDTYRLIASCRTSEKELLNAIQKLNEHENNFKKIAKRIKECLKKDQQSLNNLIADKDHLLVLCDLVEISAAFESEIAEDTINHAAAKAFRDLAISRLHDLREKETPHKPSITRFLRHRLEQANYTCASIRNGQDRLFQQISRSFGLLHTQMEARQQHSQHNIHFLIFAFTIAAGLYYLSMLFDHLFADHLADQLSAFEHKFVLFDYLLVFEFKFFLAVVIAAFIEIVGVSIFLIITKIKRKKAQ